MSPRLDKMAAISKTGTDILSDLEITLTFCSDTAALITDKSLSVFLSLIRLAIAVERITATVVIDTPSWIVSALFSLSSIDCDKLAISC